MEGFITKNLDGEVMYNFREAGYYLGRTSATLRNWNKLNNELIKAGKPGILPSPALIGGVLHYSRVDIDTMRRFMRWHKKGDIKRLHKEVNGN